MDKNNNWRVWQLADSAFPSGGFVHSGGLEAAYQDGEIRDAGELCSFVEAALFQTLSGSIPFVVSAFDDTLNLRQLDDYCDAFLSNHVANRASRTQGRAFLNSARRIFGPIEIPACEFCHWPPLFGAVHRKLSINRSVTVELFLYNTLRGVISAAVRLGLAGPLQAQALQQSLAPRACSLARIGTTRTLDDVATSAPLLDIWQGSHDRLYSRLFQS